MDFSGSTMKTPWNTLAIIAFIIIMLIAGGHFYYYKQKSEIKSKQHALLAAISSLKVNEIQNWLNERKAEARYLDEITYLKTAIRDFKKHPKNLTSRAQILDIIIPLKQNHEYLGICLYDDQAKPVMVIGDQITCQPLPKELLSDPYGLRKGEIILSDLTIQPETGKPFITITSPLSGQQNMLGYLQFYIDPAVYLFPLISQWPSPSKTSENILVRIDGNHITYLNKPKRGDPAMVAVKIPHRQGSVSRMVPPGGTIGMVEATDYSGEKVLADVRKIGGTNWSLISKVDLDEIYAPVRKNAANIISFLSILLILAIVAAILISKNQQLRYFRSQYDQQKQRVQAEEMIRYQNALLQNVNDAIITYNKDLIIQSWNKGAENMYGWKTEEVVGKYAGGSLRTDFPDGARDAVFKDLSEKGTWKGEMVHRRKDGSSVYVLSTTSQLLDDQDNVLGIISINKDISDILQSEKIKNSVYRISELAHASGNLDELFSNIHIVIGELMDASNMYIALLDEDGEHLSFPYFIDEKDDKPLPKVFGKGLTEYVIRTGKPVLAQKEDIQYFIEREIIEVTGHLAESWLGIPLQIQQKTIGVLTLQSYSTRTRFHEKEKEMLIYVSEQVALSISRIKMQQELIEAKENAESSNKLTSSLLANMNHELRTPMNGILGFADILSQELKDPDEKAKAENILISGRRLMDTIDSIMDLSYLESTKTLRTIYPVSVSSNAEAIVNKYKATAINKNLTIRQAIQPDLYIMGQDNLLRHLLRHLVDNAIKYTNEGGITIEASESGQLGPPMVKILVQDTGIGIDPAYHQLIFEDFRQVSEGYSREFEGTGLGLALVKRIVYLLNGSITLESKLGVGSVFTIMIPEAGPGIKQAASHNTSAGGLTGKKELVKPNVLLVEDNSVNIQLTIVYLRKHCHVFSASNGRKAISLAEQRLFDIVLMDINLGTDIDGTTTMRRMRKIPGYQGVPFVALTGYASIEDRDRLLAEGFDHYLPKPFTREELIQVILAIFPTG